MVELIYHPTPLEEAYGIYLLETVFGPDAAAAAANSTTANNSASSTAAAPPPFGIAGRHAVPFLSRARGLGRGALREIWGAVDPAAAGRLTSPLQFHAALRLIALGQAGLLLPAATATAEALRQCLAETAHRTDVPLAAFEGHPIPGEAALRALYVQRKCGGGGATANNNGSEEPGTSPAAAAAAAAAESAPLGTAAAAVAVVPSSRMEDAFGGLLGDVQDAPLPSLSATATPAAGLGAGGWDHNNNNNNNHAAAPRAVSVSSQVSEGSAAAAAAAGDSPFASRMAAATAPSAAADDPFASNVTMASSSNSNAAGFSNISIITSNTAADPFATTAASTRHDPFGSSSAGSGPAAVEAAAAAADADFGAFSSQAATTTTSAENNNKSNRDDGVFGGFAASSAPSPPSESSASDGATAAAATGFGTAATTVVAVGDWGALDALAAVPDAPLPGLAAAPAPAVSNAAAAATAAAVVRGDEDARDDSFGNFAGGDGAGVVVVEEAAAASPAPGIVATAGKDSTAAQPAAAATEDDSFGDFGGAAAATTSTGAWGAFAALAPNVAETAPQPTQQQQQQQQPPAAAAEEDFGGFLSSGEQGAVIQNDLKQNHPPTAEVGWGAFDALAEVQDAPLPTLGGGPADPTTSNAPEPDDDFGGFVGTDSQPAPENEDVSAPVVVDDDDDFGQFEGTSPSEPPAAVGGPVAPATAGGSTEDAWGAFDALADVQDAPLPSLSTPASETQTGTVVGDEAVNNDLMQTEPTNAEGAWGAFDAKEPAEPPSIDAPVSNSENDGFGGFVSQPSATAGNVSSPGVVDDDDFGQFESTVPSNSNEGNAVAPEGPEATGGATADAWGAFDALADVQDAPLPSLSQPASNKDDGEFGGFVGSGDEAASIDPKQAEPARVGWGAFDALAEVQDAPLPIQPGGTSTDRASLSESGDQSDSFGGFAGSDDALKEQEVSEGEDFGDFVGRDDAAQSSDGNVGKSEEEKDVPSPEDQERTGSDDFGWGALDAVAPTQDAPLPSLGAFGSAGETTVQVKDNPASESEDFGDFAGVGATGDEIQASGQRGAPLQNVDERERTDSAFYSADMKPESSVGSEELIGFGDAFESMGRGDGDGDGNAFSAFDSPTGAKADSLPSPAKEGDLVADGTEVSGDFGGFEAAPSSAADTGIENSPMPSEAVEHMHAFETAQTESKADSTSGETPRDDEFGDFASFDAFAPTPVDNASADSHAPESKDAFGVEGDDDWDAFQVASSDKKAPTDIVQEKDVIVAKSLKLPEAIRRKLDGDFVDFNDIFDAHIGLETPLTEDRKDRLQRASQLLQLLSISHSKLASTYWAQCFAVARDELSKAVQLFQEAMGFSPGDREHVCGSLQDYLAGLREFVRVARFVTATIGDLLMLEQTALLTIDTLSSSWCSIALVSEALEVENLWRDVEQCGLNLGLTMKNEKSNPLASLTQIRSSRSGSCDASQLDQFTLQFLSAEESSSQSTVDWEGKPFMACTANFLAHKCAFYVVTA